MPELTQFHPSEFRDFRYVYPVISRRAGGVSVGINLNPDGNCSFDCVYCQVQSASKRGGESALQPGIDTVILEKELRAVIRAVLDGSLFDEPWFAKTPTEKRVLKDIAFAGDGEPTICKQFPAALDVAIKVRDEIRPQGVKIVLITNATMLQKPSIRVAIARLTDNNGEIWAKLDAGSESVFQRINRTKIPFSDVLNNIISAGRENPIVIQSCFFQENNVPLPETELAVYIDRIKEILDKGGNLKQVQIYTVARDTAEKHIAPLPDDRLEEIGEMVRKGTNLTVEVFFSR